MDHALAMSLQVQQTKVQYPPSYSHNVQGLDCIGSLSSHRDASQLSMKHLHLIVRSWEICLRCICPSQDGGMEGQTLMCFTDCSASCNTCRGRCSC